ncbi:MAG TPA: hypothetical protein VJN95_09850 [Gemmatimonadales bacterium]|nr:hypothetical protein [Gemmatimonadales bacterium]
MTDTVSRQQTAARYLFAAALAGFAVQALGAATGIGMPPVGPPFGPVQPVWAYLEALVLLGGSAAIALNFNLEKIASGLGVLAVLYSLAVYFVNLIHDIHDGGSWTSGAELLCLGGILLVLAGARFEGAGRVLYAAPLLVFAVQHFIYSEYVASLIPKWIPGPWFWTYFIAVAFVAATAAIISGRLRWLAGTLLGIQFLTWVVILHFPRVLHATDGRGNEWTSLFMALAMGAGAWIVAGKRPLDASR